MDLIIYSVLTVLGLSFVFFSVKQVFLSFTSESQKNMESVLSRDNGAFICHGAVIDKDGVKSDHRLADN